MTSQKQQRKKRRRERRKVKPYLYLNTFLRHTVGSYFLSKFNVEAKNRNLVVKTKPPYLIMPNHVNNFDPILVNSLVPTQIYFVTSDATFRSPILKFVLNLVGAIPKTKAINDFDTIRTIMYIKNLNGVIGIFPEGYRSWDGHTMPLIYSTAKLVKLLKIPVIVPILHGSFLAQGRWTRFARKGKIVIHFHYGLSPEDCKKLTVEEIYQKLTELLEYDESEYQKTAMVPFKGRRLAENLERALFICPHCKKIGSMRSRRSLFYCINCHHTLKFNKYGFLEKHSESFYFQTIHEWNDWQMQYLKTYLEKKVNSGTKEALFVDKRALVRTGFRSDPLKKLDFGRVALYTDRVEIHPEKESRVLLKRKVFPIHEISGMNVQTKEGLEYYHRDILWRLDFLSRHISAYKWVLSIKYLQEII